MYIHFESQEAHFLAMHCELRRAGRKRIENSTSLPTSSVLSLFWLWKMYVFAAVLEIRLVNDHLAAITSDHFDYMMALSNVATN